MTEQQQVATDGVVDRALGLLSDQVLTVTALCLVGVVFSWAYTQARKPYIPEGSKRKLKIRMEAMVVAAIVSALLLTLVVSGSAWAKTVVVLVLAPFAGLMSPILFDIWTGWAWPYIRSKVSKKLADDGCNDADTPTILKNKKKSDEPPAA